MSCSTCDFSNLGSFQLLKLLPRANLRIFRYLMLTNYFDSLNGQKPGDLYELVLGQVEEPLFKAVMKYAKGNQSRASEILGINRGTLRKKLKTYSITS